MADNDAIQIGPKEPLTALLRDYFACIEREPVPPRLLQTLTELVQDPELIARLPTGLSPSPPRGNPGH